MSESSLPPFGPARFRFFQKIFRPPRLRKRLKYLYTLAGGRRDTGNAGPVQGSSALEFRAEKAVHEYLTAHASLLERAARLREKAERLEKAGTPSESARNRAERARWEVMAGLATLRASFVEANRERDGAPAFDRVVQSLCPAFASHRPWDRLS